MYFLSGFDPRGASHYFRLFGQQLRELGARQGQPWHLERLRSPEGALISRWRIADPSASPVELVFLQWDDLARQHWPRNPARLLLDWLPIYGWYLLGGEIGRAHV